ncbi:DUF6503 family protein, partial [Fulvivirga aurantia]|uniref:DUF6503 family protein n=1 Tax=Fulvivirga aurantia TaxID=2529383 RepID=UPI0016293477
NTASSDQTDNDEIKVDVSQYPELLAKALEAHGGLDTWRNFGTLRYDKVSSEGNSENHIINLYNRKVLIDRDTTQIGFDGKEVWVSPNLESFGSGSARFYHNLYFYFFGIPFLLSDPGIMYEDLGTQTVNGTDYRALKVSYGEGVGDSDEDLYIAHFNPETYKLELLLYTVTYYSGEKTENYNALAYSDWQQVNGLEVPKKFVGYKYADGKLGDKRYEASFDNVKFEEKVPNPEIFKMAENSEIDSLKTK